MNNSVNNLVKVKEHPILFSGPMVRAILEGRKAQTRRTRGLELINENPDAWTLVDVGVDSVKNRTGAQFETRREIEWILCPYGKPGDGLWVRETWLQLPNGAILYKATDAGRTEAWRMYGGSRWYPSIHMRRHICRIVLEITGVRVQRVQEISEADALAEGAAIDMGHAFVLAGHETEWAHATAKGCYETLWDSLNAGRGFGWQVNPWVWVIEFKRMTK